MSPASRVGVPGAPVTSAPPAPAPGAHGLVELELGARPLDGPWRKRHDSRIGIAQRDGVVVGHRLEDATELPPASDRLVHAHPDTLADRATEVQRANQRAVEAR